jgi:DNA-binding MarR family transcriptional regulator
MKQSNFIKVKLDFVEDDLSFTELAVLSYLASMSKKDYVFATNKHLSKILKINNRTLYRVLSSLEEKDLIRRVTKSLGKIGKERRIYVHPSVKSSYLYK